MIAWLPVFAAIYGIVLMWVYILNHLSTVIVKNKMVILAIAWNMFALQAIMEPSLWAPTQCAEELVVPNVTLAYSIPVLMSLYNNDTRSYGVTM
tara:strand:- start:894 stop:1175 length:282 start_codon:yes stop_codon:yes gene_type:complete